jgi:hypothetical protein
MKHFVMGLLIILAIIAVVVIIKRIGGHNDPTANPDSSSADITAGADGGDVLPQ